MDMFAHDDDVAHWELALLPLRGLERLPVLLPLAWHLRQRDSLRAIELADEADTLLIHAGDATAAGRLRLLRAEVAWLMGELESAGSQAGEALHTLRLLGDDAGCADAHWLRAWIAVDHGDHVHRDAELAECARAARAAGDGEREAIADAASARWAVLRDIDSARERWGHRFDLAAEAPPALDCWINDFLGMAASQSSDFGGAAGFYLRTYEAALETGQLRAAIIAATNIGEKFSNLNDHHSALEWLQRGLDIARPTGWPRSIGAALLHTADTVRRLGRLEAAEELLREAFDILRPYASSRLFAIALQYQGDLCLARDDFAGALDAFERLAVRADVLEQADFRMVARRGQAHALCFLDRPREALVLALEAVELAHGHHNPYNHIAGLRVLALIHSRAGAHRLPPPAAMREADPALHYLHRALDTASTIQGYTVPGSLYDALADRYAHLGDYRRAYDMARAAGVSHEKTHSQEATGRAIAMQVHQQTEQARAEGLHHRELAMSEARRAELLQQTSATLERLSAIGREITIHLDAAAVYEVLNRYVNALLAPHIFAVYLLEEGHVLVPAFTREGDSPMPPTRIELDDTTAWCARCVRERREVYIEDAAAEPVRGPLPEATASALYVPLLVGERVLGVMSAQSTRPHAYGERERLIFRTLCAYGAIALDNAQAYRQLQEAQSQLVSQEKLAALGALMAGVAHELNTPIGNSLLIASTLEQKTDALEKALNGPGLRRSELAAFIADTHKASELVMRGLRSAAELVASFKQVAVDRTTEQRRPFDLQQVTREIVATVMNRIRASSHRLIVDVPEGVALDSYPGPFGQVVTNLINNALLHAFDGREGGTMTLAAAVPADGHVTIVFADDGAGIAPEHLSRIYDPFFTTKLGQGGSGLGLSISYNIVTSLLGGSIAVASSPAGTTFTLALPLVAPSPDPASPATIY
ncbi:ATP-binding protein [Pseudoduganella buxea]|uniref:histidine kinase n=1 Tax=Pseudoduganella buxea TaxID=1949069 RepID=A0A6I3T0Y2_9BURK|nr:ATP-binding protein [Pseudoduganella buxea]MTV54964.1 GAF domain-containing protein [Pseudoduganella buxea]GGC20501.1 hypothetical protein GCM10011572_47400 [Pseudoduganella buxea]